MDTELHDRGSCFGCPKCQAHLQGTIRRFTATNEELEQIEREEAEHKQRLQDARDAETLRKAARIIRERFGLLERFGAAMINEHLADRIGKE